MSIYIICRIEEDIRDCIQELMGPNYGPPEDRPGEKIVADGRRYFAFRNEAIKFLIAEKLTEIKELADMIDEH